jgi:hypothetical protein
MQRLRVGDFLTDRQGEIVVGLWNELSASPQVFIETIIARIIHPSIDQINARCGQRMNERHLAVVIAQALRQHAPSGAAPESRVIGGSASAASAPGRANSTLQSKRYCGTEGA